MRRTLSCHISGTESRKKLKFGEVQIKSKSNLSLYSLYYAEACNKFAGPISASLRPVNTASFEEMLLRWLAVGKTWFILTCPRCEPQTSRSRNESVTARATCWSFAEVSLQICQKILRENRAKKNL